MEAPFPRKELVITVAPAALADSSVPSMDPSSITRTSPTKGAFLANLTTRATVPDSLSAGMTTVILGWTSGFGVLIEIDRTVFGLNDFAPI